MPDMRNLHGGCVSADKELLTSDDLSFTRPMFHVPIPT